MTRTSRSLLLASALPLVALLGACHTPGGAGVSNDTYTFISTAHEPKTVTIRDTRSMENVLTVEIPVGQQLVVSFYNTDDEADGKGTMKWGVMPAGRTFGGLDYNMDVPPASVRRLDVSLRRAPEYAKPLNVTRGGELPKGVTIADDPGARRAPAQQQPTRRELEIEATSPANRKVDIPD